MNKHFGVSWGIAVIAILGVLVWQALSIVELYHFQNERFITKVNHRITRTVNELNCLQCRSLLLFQLYVLFPVWHLQKGKKSKGAGCREMMIWLMLNIGQHMISGIQLFGHWKNFIHFLDKAGGWVINLFPLWLICWIVWGIGLIVLVVDTFLLG